MAKRVVVIRIGSKTTHIVDMENIATNPTVYNCCHIPTPPNSIREGSIVDVMSLSTAIKTELSRRSINVSDVIFTIASSKIASRETTIPSVNKTKIDGLVNAKIPDLFPVDVERYVFAHVVQGAERQDGESGKVLDVRVFAAPAELVDEYYMLAETLRMNVVALEADANSVFQIMRRQVTAGVAMSLQINADATLINIISSDRLLLQRAIPYGTNVFTEPMLQDDAFQVTDEEKAHHLLATQKVLVHHLNEENSGDDYSLGKRIEVTNNGEYLISNISRVIEYYNSNHKEDNDRINEIIVTGQGASIAGIHELLTNELSIHSHSPVNLSGIRFNKKVLMDASLLQFANGFGSVFSPVGFLPGALARKKANKGSLTVAGLIFALLFVLSAGMIGFSFLQLANSTEERDAAKIKHDGMVQYEERNRQLKDMEEDYEIARSLDKEVRTNGNEFYKLVTQFEQTVPKSFKITAVRGSEDTVSITAASFDKLSSISALVISLNKNIPNICDVKVDQVATEKDKATKRQVYKYSFDFYYTNKKLEQQKAAEAAAMPPVDQANTEGGE